MQVIPCSLSVSQDLHQFFDFGLAESAGWLIQDQDLGIFRERLGDLDHLHFADPQVLTTARGSTSS